MVKVENSPVILSILDRLSDDQPEIVREGSMSRTQSLRKLKQSVVRDLAWLLNTRQSPDEEWSGATDLKTSLLSFGLPDFTGLNPRNHKDREKLRHSIEAVIGHYEPRLKRVRITVHPLSDDRSLHFRVTALLNLQPSPEPIVFDTVLNLTTANFHLQEI